MPGECCAAEDGRGSDEEAGDVKYKSKHTVAMANGQQQRSCLRKTAAAGETIKRRVVLLYASHHPAICGDYSFGGVAARISNESAKSGENWIQTRGVCTWPSYIGGQIERRGCVALRQAKEARIARQGSECE